MKRPPLQDKQVAVLGMAFLVTMNYQLVLIIVVIIFLFLYLRQEAGLKP